MASLNMSLTRLAPTPTNNSTKSDPLIKKNGTFASPAIAFASNVFPVPGGPTKSTPLGILAPNFSNFLGFFKKSINSDTSSFSSSSPATSLNLFLSLSLLNLALLLPKSIEFLLELASFENKKYIIIIIITSGRTLIKIYKNTLPPGSDSVSYSFILFSLTIFKILSNSVVTTLDTNDSFSLYPSSLPST